MQKITGLAQGDPVAPGSPQSWGISRHYSISCQGRNKHIKSQGEPTLSRSICNRAGTFEVIFGNKSWRKLTYISKHWKVYRSVPYFRSSKLIREILLAYHRGREHGREGGGGKITSMLVVTVVIICMWKFPEEEEEVMNFWSVGSKRVNI